MTKPIDNRTDVVCSFDTTGSMYPCLTQVGEGSTPRSLG